MSAKKVELTPLAIVDLSVSYARKMDDKKIIHYRISHLMSLMDPNGNSPFARVVEHIREEEGDDVEVVLNDTVQVELQRLGSAMAVADVSSSIPMASRTRKALLQRKATSLIHQYNIYNSKLDQYKDLISYKLNEVIFKINSAIQTVKGKPYTKGSSNDSEVTKSVMITVRGFLPKTFEYLRTNRYNRAISLVRYIGVTYKESQEKEAFAALAQDLDTLQSHGLIQGHLSMPATLMLADTLGSGDRLKAVFCFLIINDVKAAEFLGRSQVDMPRMFLSLFGVRHEMSEGAVPPYLNGVDPKTEFQIEVIDLLPGQSDVNRQAVLSSYMDSREHVNRVAANQRQELKNMGEQERQSVTVGEMVKSEPIRAYDEEGNLVAEEIVEDRFVAKEVHVRVGKKQDNE